MPQFRVQRMPGRKRIAASRPMGSFFTDDSYSFPGHSETGGGLSGFFATGRGPLPGPNVFGKFNRGMGSFFANADGRIVLPARSVFGRFTRGMGCNRGCRGLGDDAFTGSVLDLGSGSDLSAGGSDQIALLPVTATSILDQPSSDQIALLPATASSTLTAPDSGSGPSASSSVAPAQTAAQIAQLNAYNAALNNGSVTPQQAATMTPQQLAATAAAASGTPFSLTNWLAQTSTLPVFGTVKHSSILIGGGIAFAAFSILPSLMGKKRRRR